MTGPADAERAWDVCRTTLGWEGEREVQRNTFLAGWHARDPEFERLRQQNAVLTSLAWKMLGALLIERGEDDKVSGYRQELRAALAQSEQSR